MIIESIEVMKKFRINLAELREKQGLSRMDIVRQAGISYTTIHSWENGLLKSVDAEKLAKVMESVQCDDIREILEIVEASDE